MNERGTTPADAALLGSVFLRLGDTVETRRQVVATGLSTLPGSPGEDATPSTATEALLVRGTAPLRHSPPGAGFSDYLPRRGEHRFF